MSDTLSNPWETRPMPGDEPRVTTIGDLTLRERFDGRDFWLAGGHDVAAPPDKEPDLRRWPLNADCKSVTLTPLFPDRPVVVETEIPICLTPGGQTRIYARCPLWVRIDLIGGKQLAIEEFPTVILSNTWFGAFTDGTLGYWVSSRTRTQIEPDPSRPWMAICPVHIRNRSDVELKIERICLRVERLALFAEDGQLWADETRVAYRGPDSVSRIENTGKRPAEAAGSRLVSSPRVSVKESFTARTFTSLKALSQSVAQ